MTADDARPESVDPDLAGIFPLCSSCGLPVYGEDQRCINVDGHTISLGDLDMWSFPATNGDAIILRMSSSGFATPRIDLYSPLGKLLGTAASAG